MFARAAQDTADPLAARAFLERDEEPAHQSDIIKYRFPEWHMHFSAEQPECQIHEFPARRRNADRISFRVDVPGVGKGGDGFLVPGVGCGVGEGGRAEEQSGDDGAQENSHAARIAYPGVGRSPAIFLSFFHRRLAIEDQDQLCDSPEHLRFSRQLRKEFSIISAMLSRRVGILWLHSTVPSG